MSKTVSATDRAHVHVTVVGMCGTGKSRITAEIEVALRAVGVPVVWGSIGDQRAAEAEHWALASHTGPAVTEWPIVVLSEYNVPSTTPTMRLTDVPDS